MATLQDNTIDAEYDLNYCYFLYLYCVELYQNVLPVLCFESGIVRDYFEIKYMFLIISLYCYNTPKKTRLN